MFFHIDPFRTYVPTVVVHRRRSSRAVASLPFAGVGELPVLAIRSRARTAKRSGFGRVFSFHAWARALGLARRDPLAALSHALKGGPRAA